MQDRLMRGNEVDRLLQAAQEQSDANLRYHQETIANIQRAMTGPQVVEDIRISAVAVGVEKGQRVLCIATPDGRRRDVLLTPQVEKMILQGLQTPVEEEKAA